jgi:hypothetical protein
MSEETEQRLKKFGLPASYVAVTAMIVNMACEHLGACV